MRVAPEQPHRCPRVGRIRPEHHPQRRGLAGAVGTEVAVDVAGLDGEVDAVDGHDLAVALDEPADLDGRRAHCIRPRTAASAVAFVTDPTTVYDTPPCSKTDQRAKRGHDFLARDTANVYAREAGTLGP